MKIDTDDGADRSLRGQGGMWGEGLDAESANPAWWEEPTGPAFEELKEPGGQGKAPLLPPPSIIAGPEVSAKHWEGG